MNHQPADRDALCKVFDSVEPKTYDRKDKDMVPEHRLGFIAQAIQAVLLTNLSDVTNVISERPLGEEQLLALDYSRLVTVLWSKVKQLEARITTLESQ